jgi:hypothetical protein
MVRISHLKTEFQRLYQEQFTTEIFKVYRRYRTQGLPIDELRDFQNQEIRGSFYQSELQKIYKDQDALWYVDNIIRKRKRKGKTEYLVSFDGRSDKNNQWIPEKDIINEKEQDK